MELTPEQQKELEKAKAAGRKRVQLGFTAGQRNEWRAAVEAELACQHENIEHIRKIRVAAEQPGFFGDVRRAIILSRRPITELADEIDIDNCVLSEFRTGEADLPAANLDRLLTVLGLRLMQEIPR